MSRSPMGPAFPYGGLAFPDVPPIIECAELLHDLADILLERLSPPVSEDMIVYFFGEENVLELSIPIDVFSIHQGQGSTS